MARRGLSRAMMDSRLRTTQFMPRAAYFSNSALASLCTRRYKRCSASENSTALPQQHTSSMASLVLPLSYFLFTAGHSRPVKATKNNWIEGVSKKACYLVPATVSSVFSGSSQTVMPPSRCCWVWRIAVRPSAYSKHTAPSNL